jgi:hypothetical protein
MINQSNLGFDIRYLKPIPQPSDFLTSRSAIECYQECPRRRYLQYLWCGVGIVPIKLAVPLVTGSAVHLGFETILRQVKKDNYKIQKGVVDEGVRVAKEYYDKEVSNILSLRANKELDEIEKFTYAEQKALVEGIIWGFRVKILPQLLAEYEIVDIEREEGDYLAPGIFLQGKVDLVVKDRKTGNLVLVNFKTCKDVDERKKKELARDMQGLSETWLVEKRIKRINKFAGMLPDIAETTKVELGEACARTFGKIYNVCKDKLLPDRVEGVKYISCLKGKSYKSRDVEGLYCCQSPLIGGYRRLEGTEWLFAHSWNWYDENGRKRALGKGWTSFNAWESEFGVKEWVKMLVSGMVQGEYEGDIVGEQFYLPQVFNRRKLEMEGWEKEVIAQESRIQYVLLYVHDAQRFYEILDKNFPKCRKSCHYPTDCDFVEICFEKPIEILDPMISSGGKFKWREPHHEFERVRVLANGNGNNSNLSVVGNTDISSDSSETKVEEVTFDE